jgi:hypothetical protein
MFRTFSAIRSAISSLSMAQGPQSKKKLFELVCFSFGMSDNCIDLKFSNFSSKVTKYNTIEGLED